MNSKLHAESRLAWVLSACLVSSLASSNQTHACDPNPDPLGLAGPHTVFINNCTTGTSIVASNNYTREQAMNPLTPLRDPFGLRLTSRHSKLLGATPEDPVGDTVYIRGGTYYMPLISVWNRVVFWQENKISIKAYPGEQVIIRGSTYLPGGNPPNTFCYPVAGQGFCGLNQIFQFWLSNDVTIEGITFIGNTEETIQIDGIPVTGKVCAPYVLFFWECNRLVIRNVTIRDFASVTDIAMGHRYRLDPGYMHTEYMCRGLTVKRSKGLELDHVQIHCSPDDPEVTDQYSIPWNIVGFITENIVGDEVESVRVHDCSFGACAGNAVEFSTVVQPQRNILFDNNTIDNWKNGIQIGGSGLSENMEIKNNRITYNHYSLLLWGNGGYGLKVGNSEHLKITNNVIYNGLLDGIGIDLVAAKDSTGVISRINDTTIAHNTLYRAGSRAISLCNMPNVDGSLPENGITRTTVVNNLIYQINTISAQSLNSNNPKRELYLQFFNFEENQGFGNTFRNNVLVPGRSDGKSVGSADFGHWLLNGGVTGNPQCYSNSDTPGCVWLTCAPASGCDIPTRYKYNAAQFNSQQSFAHNNIDATESDPMFVDAASADFHLVAGSPAVNQALCLPHVPTDIDGVVRANGGGCSIGAYEFDPPIMGDLNCDSLVNMTDVSVLILALTNPTAYAQTYNCIENSDLNQDGQLNGRDLRGFVDLLTP